LLNPKPSRKPEIVTVYVLAVLYVWEADVAVCVVTVPSPQLTSKLCAPLATKGRVMLSSEVVVVHSVMKSW
jgi:hypothetical protein